MGGGPIGLGIWVPMGGEGAGGRLRLEISDGRWLS